MDIIQNIVVVGSEDGNQSKLHTNLRPFKLDENIGMCVTSFSHGEIHNIHEENNMINIKLKYEIDSIISIPKALLTIPKNLNSSIANTMSIKIPIGRYETTFSLLKAIELSVKRFYFEIIQNVEFDDIRSHVLSVINELITIKKKSDHITILVKSCEIIVGGGEGKQTPWSLMGILTDLRGSTNPKLDIQNRNLTSDLKLAFLYVNIVENSYINGKLSRNLSVLPLYDNNGGAFYEFKNPTYVPVAVREFSNILLEIRDMNGKYIPFDKDYNTVITLNLKPINRTYQ